MARVSSWGWWTQIASDLVKMMSSDYGAWPAGSLEPVVCTMVWWGLFAFRAYFSLVHQPLLTSRGPLNIILTSFLSSIWVVFPLNLGVFYLYRQAFLAIRTVTSCSLATTLGFAVRCNTTIRAEFVHCALVTYGIKYIHLLATTLGIVVCCNTSIRLESVHCLLMTHG